MNYSSVQCCFCVKPGGSDVFRCCVHPDLFRESYLRDWREGGCWSVVGEVHREINKVETSTTITNVPLDIRSNDPRFYFGDISEEERRDAASRFTSNAAIEAARDSYRDMRPVQVEETEHWNW